MPETDWLCGTCGECLTSYLDGRAMHWCSYRGAETTIDGWCAAWWLAPDPYRDEEGEGE